MSLQALIATGSKIWLDSIKPDEIDKFSRLGITGATSNPIIISEIIEAGGFDDRIRQLIGQGLDDAAIAWGLTDQLVAQAQQVFANVWDRTAGDDGYVSFELDPLLEDAGNSLSQEQRTQRYVELGQRWGLGRRNRMIKVPATAAGLAALEELAAAGVTLNVTLCFTECQYTVARDAIWRGAQRRKQGLDGFKSVYSIFVSRVDVYTEKRVPELSPQAQGMVGIVNAKQMWQLNRDFWRDKKLPLKQEIIFASTGTKRPADPPDRYVEALAGSDIQTNPPKTLDAVQEMHKSYRPALEQLPPPQVIEEIRQKVDVPKMEATLMAEGTEKFAKPQKELQQLIGQKRGSLSSK